MIDFKIKLAENLSFEQSFTQIKTNELLRFNKMLEQIANDKRLKIKEWNILDGWVRFDSKKRESDFVEEVVDIYQLNMGFLDSISIPDYKNTIIVIDLNGVPDAYCSMLEHKLQKLIYRIEKYNASIHLILLSSQADVFEGLKSSVDYLELPLLSKAEINELIDDKNISISNYERLQLVDVCLGLSSKQIEKLIIKFDKNRNLSAILLDKKEFLSKQGLLEVVDSNIERTDIGGLDLLQSWLQRKNEIFNKLQDEAVNQKLDKPKGVLIVGMPGCGKSLTAKATANIFSMPLLKLDMGRLMGKYVGDSEKNLRQALEIASRSEPCILWIDEIEKGFAGIGGDQTGITSRLFGYFLTWLQENQSRVFVVATANDITQLPPELLRKGRFDELFFVDFPNKSERKSIFKILENKYSDFIQGQLDLDVLVDKTEGYSGADIHAIFQQSVEDSIIDNKKIDLDKIESVIKQTMSMQKNLGEKLKEYQEKFKKFQLKPASLSDEEIKKRLQSYSKLSLQEKRQESQKNYLSDEEMIQLAKEIDPIIIKNLLKKDNCPADLLNKVLKQHLQRKSLPLSCLTGDSYTDNEIILNHDLVYNICKNKNVNAEIIIDLYKNSQISKKEMLEILAVRRDIDKFLSILNKKKAKVSRDIAFIIDEILIFEWQVIKRDEKILSSKGKRFSLEDKYPEYLLVSKIVAKAGQFLSKNDVFFEYIEINER